MCKESKCQELIAAESVRATGHTTTASAVAAGLRSSSASHRRSSEIETNVLAALTRGHMRLRSTVDIAARNVQRCSRGRILSLLTRDPTSMLPKKSGRSRRDGSGFAVFSHVAACCIFVAVLLLGGVLVMIRISRYKSDSGKESSGATPTQPAHDCLYQSCRGFFCAVRDRR